MSAPAADDFGAIAARLRELEAARGLPARPNAPATSQTLAELIRAVDQARTPGAAP